MTLPLTGRMWGQTDGLLEKYRAMALDYNHDLKAAQKHLSACLELEKAAQKGLLPTVQGMADFQFTGNPLELSVNLPGAPGPLTFTGKDLKYGAALSVVQPVYTGGRLLENIRRAQTQQRISEHERERIRQGVCLQTDLLYWQTVAHTEAMRIAEDHLKAAEELVNTIGERVEAGLTNPQDLLMAEVKRDEAEVKRVQAQLNLENSRMMLNTLIGVEPEAMTLTADSINLPEDVPGEKGGPRPEELTAWEQVELARSDKRLTGARYKPQLMVGVDGSMSSPGYNFKSDMDPNYVVYAKLAVPVFEWGKRRHELAAADRRMGMAQDRLNRVRDELELERQTAHNSLLRTMQQAELAGKSLHRARANELLALDRYAEGRASVIEVIEAQSFRQAAQLNEVQAKLSVRNAYAMMLKAGNGYSDVR